MRAGTFLSIVVLCAASACMGPGSDALTGLATASGGGGGATSGRLAFLVQPNNAVAGGPISPEVKIVALDTLGSVLSQFSGRVFVTLASNPSGGSLRGTTSAAAASGLAIFDTLVINQAGSGYMLVASASGMASVTSAPFTVFGATGSAVQAP
jgi:hypothetical protein